MICKISGKKIKQFMSFGKMPIDNWFLKKKDLSVFTEDYYLLLYLTFLVGLFFVFFNKSNNFSITLFSLISSVSNIGFSFGTYNQNNFIFFCLCFY